MSRHGRSGDAADQSREHFAKGEGHETVVQLKTEPCGQKIDMVHVSLIPDQSAEKAGREKQIANARSRECRLGSEKTLWAIQYTVHE